MIVNNKQIKTENHDNRGKQNIEVNKERSSNKVNIGKGRGEGAR